MKKFFTLLAGLLCLAGVVQAQACTEAVLDWDYLDFFPSAGHSTYTNLAKSQTQYFAFGTQRVTITHNYTGSNALGENITNTAAGTTFGAGADLEFLGNGQIRVVFQEPVTNIKFTLYDIDASQRVDFAAVNGTTPVAVNLVNFGTPTNVISNNNLANAYVTGTSNSNAADNSVDGAVNVTIAGTVTQVTMTVSATGVGGCNSSGKNCSESGSFWLSDIRACSTGSFPANYHAAARPFTGQPGYVLVAKDNSVYYVNPLNGIAKLLFTDPNAANLNSVAYDPVNKFVYYVWSLTNGGSIGTNKTLRRYDYNMDTLGIVIDDVNKLGVPTFAAGTESGGASFFNGSLYLGVEAGSSSGFESIIWKIDFNAAHQPTTVTQQWSIDNAKHDWSDFVIANGVLYDFDGSVNSDGTPNYDFFHQNMLTNVVTQVVPAAGVIPRQSAVDWQGQVYNVGGLATNSTNAAVVPYLYNGNQSATQRPIITLNGVAMTGSFGDAAEGFVPKADFGDAPASYDPDPMAPAMHELSSSLRLGGALDVEWAKTASAGASYDGNDEDGLPFVRIISSAAGMYFTDVNVVNTTGGIATVAAWVDFNNNGIFESGEGVSTTVGSAAGTQTIQLTWSNIPQNLASNSLTYLRLRISSVANQLTVDKPSGYMADGEVEDWQVQVNVTPLSIRILDFNARKMSDTKARVTWKVEEEPGTVFSLEKSVDGSNWLTVSQVIAQSNKTNSYSFEDDDIAASKVAYRLKYMDATGKPQYSPLRTVWFGMVQNKTSIFPNPAQGNAVLHMDATKAGTAYLHLFDQAGKLILVDVVTVQKGTNNMDLKFIGRLNNGAYHVQLLFDGVTYTNKLVVSR